MTMIDTPIGKYLEWLQASENRSDIFVNENENENENFFEERE